MKNLYNPRTFALASVLFGVSCQLGAHATESTPTGSGTDIDKVINELTHQHSNSSSLIKSARQPASLALNSALVSQPKVNITDSKDTHVLGQLTAVASNTVSKFKQNGIASWYGRQFHGRKTASGETFDMNGLTAAHRTLPMNCYIRVTNKDNGKSVVVKVNDRGPFHGNRVLDLSYGAAKAIGITQKGTGNVSIERISAP
ncbi:MAG: septal ring lytic transglycosylase RlpA family protein [Moraxella sp.]|nr:septal ring lytic transglycosylase RlpA family protein [Moraxella sp.]